MLRVVFVSWIRQEITNRFQLYSGWVPAFVTCIRQEIANHFQLNSGWVPQGDVETDLSGCSSLVSHTVISRVYVITNNRLHGILPRFKTVFGLLAGQDQIGLKRGIIQHTGTRQFQRAWHGVVLIKVGTLLYTFTASAIGDKNKPFFFSFCFSL